MEKMPIELSQLRMAEFPTTRFYGSKRKQLEWLRTELEGVRGQTALDAFGGTGAVSYLLARLGWQTTYNDIFEFNVVSARAIFDGGQATIDEQELVKLLKSVRPKDGFISSTFSGMYFTDEENQWLDGFMLKVRNESGLRRDLLLYLLFQACLKKRPFNLFHRANLNLRTSAMPVQFGNRTTWSRPFDVHIAETHAELRKMRCGRMNNVKVATPRSAAQIEGEYDLIYLDPPYFKRAKRNTESYLQRYHFLEGLARFDEWEGLIDFSNPQKVIRGPYRGEWTDKLSMVRDINQLMISHPNSKFVLSYVSDEEPTEIELFDLFRGRFDRVRLSRRQFSKALSTKESFEIIITGQ